MTDQPTPNKVVRITAHIDPNPYDPSVYTCWLDRGPDTYLPRINNLYAQPRQQALGWYLDVLTEAYRASHAEWRDRNNNRVEITIVIAPDINWTGAK